MARRRQQGYRLTARDRTRIRLGNGKVRRWVSKGVFVDLDVDPLLLVAADGVAEVLGAIIDEATPHAPDDPTTPGSRIRERGGFAVYAFGQILRTQGEREGYRKPKKFRPDRNGIDGVAHFRSRLHHLHELGTVNMKARPYLGPARAAVEPRVEQILKDIWPREGVR